MAMAHLDEPAHHRVCLKCCRCDGLSIPPRGGFEDSGICLAIADEARSAGQSMRTSCSGSGSSPRTMTSCSSELHCLLTQAHWQHNPSRSLLIDATQTDAQETAPVHVCLQHMLPDLCVRHYLLGPLKAALHCRLYTGDTESFRLAFHLAGKGADYAQAAHRPSAALSAQAAARGASKASSWCRKIICMSFMHDLSVISGSPALWQVYLDPSGSFRQGLSL